MNKNESRSEALKSAGLHPIPQGLWVTAEDLEKVKSMDKKNTVPRKPRTTKPA